MMGFRKHRIVLFWLMAGIYTGGFSNPLDMKKTSGSGITTKMAQTETTDWDALHYRLDLQFPYDSTAYYGQVTLIGKAVQNGLTGITLNMDNLALDSAYSPTMPVSVSYQNAELWLSWEQGLAAGDSFSIVIDYHGFPKQAGFYMYENCAYTMAEPQDARKWFPCRDVPWDKATAEVIVTVPIGVEAASIGLLQSREKNPQTGTETFYWKTDLPVATYLICVTMSDQYARWSDWVVIGEDSIELPYYVFREDSLLALEDLKHTPRAMEIFSTLFAKYPFEKYGIATVEPTVFGGMEHQTMTTVNRKWFKGNRTYEFGFVHELAHMWWGDAVTLKNWPDIWLNESFATYAEALYWEVYAGRERYLIRMKENEAAYLKQALIKDFPVYNPPMQDLFNAGIVYAKGAFILHTLREMIGDDDFFEILRTYYQTYLYDNASTEDFIAVCEEITGGSLDWFFDQWIYGGGYPHFRYSYLTSPAEAKDHLFILDVNQDEPVFKVPMELRILNHSTQMDTLIWIDQDHQRFVFHPPFAADSVILDPENHFIAEIQIDTTSSRIQLQFPESFAISPNYPNPFNGETRFDYYLPITQTSWKIDIVVYNPLGQQVRRILRTTKEPGSYSATWDGRDNNHINLPTGVYIIAMRSGKVCKKQKVLLLR